MPILSIIICAFGRSKPLGNCLESLSKQTIGSDGFEIIAVYPESDTKIKAAINRYAAGLNIKTVSDPENGLAVARDLGWREAKGEIVSWIDDDVVVSENWAETVIKTFRENSEIGGVSGPTIIPADLLRNRDIFWFYNKTGVIGLFAKLWAWFFLEGRPYEVGKIFKSGAWSPGSNFPQCLKITGLKEVDYLEACNMSLRKSLVEKVGGFDLSFNGVGEWSEPDLAIKIKNLGYKLIFNPETKTKHYPSRTGVYAKRTMAKGRMENLFKFYFRHIFKPRLDYIFKFSCYILFLNAYWLIKTFQTGNINWLSGWLGTINGFLKITKAKD